MEKADPRVQVRLVYFGEDGGINDGIGEADERVDIIAGRPLRPFFKGKVGVLYDQVERFVVRLLYLRLHRHETFDIVPQFDRGKKSFDLSDDPVKFLLAPVVIFQYFQTIFRRPQDELPCNAQPFFIILIKFGLFEDHKTGVVMLAGIKGTHVIPVIIEIRQDDLLLRQELQHALVDVHLAEGEDLPHVLHGYELFLLVVLEKKGVILSL